MLTTGMRLMPMPRNATFPGISTWSAMTPAAALRMWGAFLGAAFIVLTPNLAESVSQSAPWMIFGFALLAVVFLAPNGLSGWITSLWRRRANSSSAQS